MKPARHLFGPVPSRRFGRSLGVDLVPSKTCSANCVFCQLGRTVVPTLERKEYVPVGEVLEELREWLAGGGSADYMSLAGSGEPTLHTRFGEVLEFIARNSPFRSALLSNGTLFHLPEVRKAASVANVVKLSLSAWDPTSFERINRPHPSLDFGRMVAGYRAFRREYRGEIWLEVFVVQGLNSEPCQVERIAALAATFSPDRVHLNTAVRPTAEASVGAVSRESMEALSHIFNPAAEAIAEFSTACPAQEPVGAADVLALLRRHPSTLEDIAGGFRRNTKEIALLASQLLQAKLIRRQQKDGKAFYVATETEQHGSSSHHGAEPPEGGTTNTGNPRIRRL